MSTIYENTREHSSFSISKHGEGYQLSMSFDTIDGPPLTMTLTIDRNETLELEQAVSDHIHAEVTCADCGDTVPAGWQCSCDDGRE